MSRPEPTIRLARPDDGPRCVAFHNAFYGQARTLAQWRWGFCRFVDADGTIPFAVAELDGEIVGTQALILIDLVDRQGPYPSAKSEATLVSKQMWGRNVFHLLYEPLLEFARRRGIASIWGFTPARRSFEREGFAVPASTRQLLRALSSSAASRLRKDVRLGRARRAVETVASSLLAAYGGVRSATSAARAAGIEIGTISGAPPWADDLSVAFVSQWGGTTIHRSQSYLEWRVFSNPFVRPVVLAATWAGRPVGWVAFGLCDDGTAAIVDLLAIDPLPGSVTAEDVAARLLDAATRRCRDMGAAAVRLWDVTGHPFAALVRRAARRLGWVLLDRGHPMVLMPLGPSRERPDGAPIHRWYVTRIFTEGTTP